MSTSKVFLNYTDWHDVDEDKVTTARYDGDWKNITMTGIVIRSLNDSPTTTLDHAASSSIRN